MPGPHALTATASPRRHLLAGATRATTTLATARRHTTPRGAHAHASRACGHLCETEALPVSGGRFVAVVRLRSDQTWLRDSVLERGALALLPGEAVADRPAE